MLNSRFIPKVVGVQILNRKNSIFELSAVALLDLKKKNSTKKLGSKVVWYPTWGRKKMIFSFFFQRSPCFYLLTGQLGALTLQSFTRTSSSKTRLPLPTWFRGGMATPPVRSIFRTSSKFTGTWKKTSKLWCMMIFDDLCIWISDLAKNLVLRKLIIDVYHKAWWNWMNPTVHPRHRGSSVCTMGKWENKTAARVSSVQNAKWNSI